MKILKQDIVKFISILIVSFILITIYSFIDYEIKFGDFVLQKTRISTCFVSKQLQIDKNTDEIIQNDTFLTQKEPVIDTNSQRILLIGDSMLEGLMLRLKEYKEENKHEMKTVIWYSSQTKWFGKYDTISYFIKQYKPTYVMLVLGANELFVRNIKEKRLKYVKRIIKQLDTLPYVWVGPPNWKDDTGINQLISENVKKERYFESKNLKLARASDGAHPTHKAARIWMDSIAAWITTKSDYRIKLNKPTQKYKTSANTTILSPLK